MIAKYTEEEYNSAKSSDKLPLVCEECGTVFYVEKKAITYAMKHPERRRLRFCTKECLTNYNKKSAIKPHVLSVEKKLKLATANIQSQRRNVFSVLIPARLPIQIKIGP